MSRMVDERARRMASKADAKAREALALISILENEIRGLKGCLRGSIGNVGGGEEE